jgi:NAD(P)H-dependent flavin oxidoreductase YrpB (nitropropane dioxygenase family)
VIATRFTELVGCSIPIEVAPMGAVSSPELVAAGSNAGALGMVGTAAMNGDQVTQMLDAVAALTDAPIGANMLMPFLDVAVVEATAQRVKLFDFYHGDPDVKLIDIVHQAGAIAGWQVGSVDEAKAAVDAGCDTIAVRGVEGGGRMHGDQPLWPLLNAVLDALPNVPVLAAGGLATERDLAAVIAAGADGVRMGTRFVATDESGAHPIYKQAIVDARATDTVLCTDFSVLWPNGPEPHRVLRRSVDAAKAIDGDVAGEAMFLGEARPMPKFAIPPPVASSSGNIEAFAMYAGMSVENIDAIEPAAHVIERIVTGAERLLASH